MSGQAAAVVASTDNSGEHNTNFQHQSPSTNDHERNESTARDHSAATQNPASHGNLVVASSAQPAARLAQEALGLSPISSAMPSTSSEAIDVAGGLSTQSAQRKEADEADNLMVFCRRSTERSHDANCACASRPKIPTRGSLADSTPKGQQGRLTTRTH
jgi:hypothetical protein